MNEKLIVDTLNQFADQILPYNLLDVYKPFNGYLDEAVQIEKKNQDAFNLILIGGLVKEVVGLYPADKDSIAILRVPIGYLLAEKMAKDKHLFDYNIYNYINLALGAFTRNFGSLDNKFVSCHRPGGNGKEFFRSLENMAAYELRFYSDNKENIPGFIK